MEPPYLGGSLAGAVVLDLAGAGEGGLMGAGEGDLETAVTGGEGLRMPATTGLGVGLELEVVAVTAASVSSLPLAPLFLLVAGG